MLSASDMMMAIAHGMFNESMTARMLLLFGDTSYSVRSPDANGTAGGHSCLRAEVRQEVLVLTPIADRNL